MKKTIFFVTFAFYLETTFGMIEPYTNNTYKRSMSPIYMREAENQNKKIKLSEIEFIRDMRDFRSFNPPFMMEEQPLSLQLTDSPFLFDNGEQHSEEEFDRLLQEYINLDQIDQSREKMQLDIQKWMFASTLKQQNMLEAQNFVEACQFGLNFPNLRKLTINVNDCVNISEGEIIAPKLIELIVLGQISDNHKSKAILIIASMLRNSLKKLEIDVNNLQYLQTDKLNLGNLRELKLTGSCISEEEFKKLEKTNARLPKHIKFQVEKISAFLVNLSLSLKILEFSNARLANKLGNLMPSMGELLGLTYLNLSKNRLTIAPKSLKNLKNLIHLDFSDNKIKIGMPEWMASFSNLTHLDLSKNNISTIPETIETFQKLAHLNLSLNYIKRLPNKLWNLKSLSYLDLSGNDISTISPMIKKAKNLTYLNLANNRVTELPESIKNLKNLTHLDLFGNRGMKFLPISMVYLFNLKYLDIRYTSIITLPGFYWWNWLNFREIYSYNLSNPKSYLYSFKSFQPRRNTQKNRGQMRPF